VVPAITTKSLCQKKDPEIIQNRPGKNKQSLSKLAKKSMTHV